MTNYHKVTRDDCLSVASKTERYYLNIISDFELLKNLASLWCKANGYRLGGYQGNWCWDSSSRR